MTTCESMHQHNGTIDSLESDYSIISEIPIVNGDIAPHGSASMDLRSVMLSATPDLSLEELRNRLIDVCEDNASLKAKIKFSNELMDRNLKAVNEWHNQMTDTMSRQKMKLEEAEEKVAMLEKENSELEAKIKELEGKKKNVVDNATSIKDYIPLSDDEVDFEVVNRKKLLKKTEDDKTDESSEYKIASLMKKVEYQKELFAELEKQYSDEAIKIRFQELPGELCEFLEKLSDLGSSLIFENFQPQSNVDKKHYSEAIKLYRERLDFYRILCCKVFQQLKKKMDDMAESLKLARYDLEEEKDKHLHTQKMFNQVQTNYDRVTALLQMESKDKREKLTVNDELEMDTKMYLDQIDKLTAQLFESEKKLLESKQKLAVKEKTVESLTMEFKRLKDEADSIPILKSQLAIHELDLNNEILARDAAQAEVQRLAKQVEELSSVTLCDSCGSSIPQTETSLRIKGKKKVLSSRKFEAKPKSEVFACPLCGFGFTNVQALENHVYECIEKSEHQE